MFFWSITRWIVRRLQALAFVGVHLAGDKPSKRAEFVALTFHLAGLSERHDPFPYRPRGGLVGGSIRLRRRRRRTSRRTQRTITFQWRWTGRVFVRDATLGTRIIFAHVLIQLRPRMDLFRSVSFVKSLFMWLSLVRASAFKAHQVGNKRKRNRTRRAVAVLGKVKASNSVALVFTLALVCFAG